MLKYQLFALDFFGGFFIFLLLLRVLSWFGGGEQQFFLRPLVAFVDPMVRPLRKFVPNLGRFETAALLVVFLVAFLMIIIELLLRGINFFEQPLLTLPIISARALLLILDRALTIGVIIILVYVVSSWVQLRGYAVRTINYFAILMLSPIRRIVKPIGAFDLSSLLFLFVLFIGSQLVNDISRGLRNFL